MGALYDQLRKLISFKCEQTSKDMATFPLGSDQSLKKAAPVTAVPIDPIPVRCIDDPWVTIIVLWDIPNNSCSYVVQSPLQVAMGERYTDIVRKPRWDL